MDDLIGFLTFLVTLIFITFVFPIVILPLFSLDNLNTIYEFFKPPNPTYYIGRHFLGYYKNINNMETMCFYVILNKRFGKYEILNLDTGEVQWQDSFKEF